MAGALPLLSRVPRHFTKTITFTGLTGAGLVNETVAVGTVTGRVLLQYLSIECTTALTGATATISLGTTTTLEGFIADTTSTDIDANEFWRDTTPEPNVSTAIINQLVNENIIINCLVANTATGVLVVDAFWLPMSVDGNLA
jgi:hypothetical protein